jgi:hypothetical protein
VRLLGLGQYSLGKRNVVTLLSASVMIQRAVITKALAWLRRVNGIG